MVIPMKMLEENINRKVSLLLKDNRILEGTLSGYDEHMNMVLDEAEESSQDSKRRLGTVVIRGSNIVRISPE
ncbi:MAG: LSM domain-containing protein [Candidatus Thermoplasmatota archaeon]|nr:LSM domain-containing protein [Candidatus Thermoplasmatota archaeon]MCL5666090.1 LSM domain-containing protein [Candidatus Thermoplasmatota archaeon]